MKVHRRDKKESGQILSKLAEKIESKGKDQLDRFASKHIGDLYNLLIPTEVCFITYYTRDQMACNRS